MQAFASTLEELFGEWLVEGEVADVEDVVRSEEWWLVSGVAPAAPVPPAAC